MRMPGNNFFQELKRRNVYRVAISYAIVGWLILQIGSIVLPTTQAPEWVMQVLLFFVVIGFPIALVLAWAFEISPQGIVRTTSVDAEENPFPASKRKPLTSNILIGFLVLLVAGQFVYNKYWNEGINTDSIEKSIAVLPFDNFSQNKDESQYLCDGFMEEIINHLSRIKVLQVRSRSSVEQYRVNRPTLPEIGQKLGVSHVLEGSVQKIGNELKVVVQLILAKEDRHIWQHDYVEQVADIFQLQSDIAKNVAEQLEIQLTAQEERLIETPPTENLRAYEFYLRGNQYLQTAKVTRRKRDYEDAILFYQKAEMEEPNFALPIAARAYLYASVARASNVLGQEFGIDSVLVLCNRAIAIDPNQALAYDVRARYYDLVLNEIGRAEPDYVRAWELDPRAHSRHVGRFYFENKNYIYGLQLMHWSERHLIGDPVLYSLYSRLTNMYIEIGDIEQARNFLDQARSIRPDFFNVFVAEFYLTSMCPGEWDKSLEILQTLQSVYPDNKLTYGLLGIYYLQTNNYKKALAYFEDASTLSWGHFDSHDYVINHTCFHGMTLWLNNRKEEGQRLVNEARIAYLELDKLQGSDLELRLAGIYAFLGNKEEAYLWLRKSKWTKSALCEVNHDVWFSNISGDREFQDIVDSAQQEKTEIREEIARLKAEDKWELE